MSYAYFFLSHFTVVVVDTDGTRISIKLATGGKALIRRFYKQDKVKAIFAAIIAATDQSYESAPFDVVTSFPTTSLKDKLELSLEECGLINSQVIMRWE